MGDLLLSDRGLTAEELAARRSLFGFNDIVETPPARWRDLIRDTARDPMIWFLLATSLLFAFLGEYTEALILLLALVPLAGMDAYLHRRTQASTQGLASRLAAQAKVLRDGAVTEVPARDLVPGDLVLLAPGEPFPADGLVVAGTELQADESALTGEAYPVRKQPIDSKALSRGGADELHWAFAGTRLLTGQARLRVTHTGGETLYGEIVRSALAGAHARTPLQMAIGGLVAILLTAALIVCVALAAIRLLQGHGLIDAFLSAVTLAVAALPEEFPVVFTFFLGVGVYRLARRQALVRRAVAVENIGRITCICSDKTGTLTEGRLILAHREPVSGSSADALVRLAALAARAESGDPLDRALIDAAGPSDFIRLATFPFTEDRRRETAVARGPDGQCLAVVKGAPETVLRMCRLEEAEAARWRKKIEGLASTGHKVIACAAQSLDEAKWPGGEPDRGYSLHGILAFEDQVRPGVKEAVRACQAAGIRVIMVTGDHPATAEAIAREIGLGGAAPVVVMGRETTDDRASFRATGWEGADVIARAIPSQKLELVRALQAAGEIVAVTGDGVNDVPALQAADIGIAMGGRGTRSAREVAAIVLLDDNFRTIVRAIAEGRQLFRNLQLSFAYLLMVHIPLVLSAAIIPLAGYPLLYLPIHIVWLELIIHPTALLVFQELPTTAELMPAQRHAEPRFFGIGSWLAIGTVGTMITAIVVFGYDFALGAGGDVEHARAMALVALIVAGAVITATLSKLSSWAARIVVLASLASLGLLVQIPGLAPLVHLRPLHLDDWVLAVAGGAAAAIPSGLVSLTIRRPRRRSPMPGRR
jgi:Ca2+-transporting ATPase